MKRFTLSIFISLILLTSANACMTAKPNAALALDPVPEVNLTGPVYDLPSPPVNASTLVSDLVNGVKFVTHHAIYAASHSHRLALGTCHKGGEAANRGAVKVKQTAAQGMNGFSIVTSFLLRIAYYSFSALASGILRS